MNDQMIPYFPSVKGSNLNGESFNLPNDFRGVFNIVVIAFRQNQTGLLEQWATALENFVTKHPMAAYYELPVLSSSYSPFRWWIDGGMRAGIVDEKARRITITIYTNKKKFKSNIGIPNEETVYLLLIDQTGKILWRTEGNFAAEKISHLQIAFEIAGQQQARVRTK